MKTKEMITMKKSKPSIHPPTQATNQKQVKFKRKKRVYRSEDRIRNNTKRTKQNSLCIIKEDHM